jgi:hypothetical protein
VNVAFIPAGTTDLTPLADWLRSAKGRFALDTETTGLDPRAPGFACKQVAFGASDGTAVVIDGADRALVRNALRLAFSDGRRWYAHYAAYDSSVVWVCYNVRLESLRDTLTAARCAWPGLVTYSLKTLRPETERRLAGLRTHWETVSGRRLGKATEKSWLPKAITTLPPDDPFVLNYIAGDAIECARLADELACLPTLTDGEHQSRQAVIAEVQHDQLWRHLTLDGLRVDRDYLLHEQKRITEEVQAAFDEYNVDLSRNSAATRQWLAERGIVCRDRNGKETLSSDWWHYAEVPPQAQQAWAAFQQVREATAQEGKIKELLELSSRDGRIYPTVGVNAADRTGRMSVSKPALQNVSAYVRGCLLPDEGMVLVGLDLSQVEPRMAAALSGDTAMGAAIKAGDVYEAAATVVWPTPPADDGERAARRKTVKTVLLAQLYGQGTTSLALRLGISKGEAERIAQALLAGWPTLRHWLRSVRNRAERGQPIVTWGGRLLPSAKETPYKAVNWLVQGSSADLFKAMVAQVAEHLPAFENARLYLPVHDELIVECRPDDAEEVATMLEQTMRIQISSVMFGGSATILGERLAHA